MRKPTIYGPGGQPLIRVRDRVAPEPRRHARMEGWVRWGLVDRRGRETTAGEQHNLILNTFIDRVAAAPISSFNAFLSHFAVGTGSTPPNVSDTSLANELARTSTQTESNTTRTGDGAYQFVLEREFDFGVANGNLTEFGFSYGASDVMLVRELFRDGSGNPITVTKTSDYKLRIRYEFDLTLTPTVLTPHSFTIAGIGVISGATTFIGRSGGIEDLAVFARAANGSLGTTWSANGAVWAALSTSVITGYSQVVTASSGGVISNEASVVTPKAYVPGTGERSFNATWGTSVGNKTGIRSVLLGPGGNSAPTTYVGWALAIDASDAFEKDDLHTLTLEDLLTVSWARA